MANRTLIMISALVLSFGLMASACSDNAEDYNMVCSIDHLTIFAGMMISPNLMAGLAVPGREPGGNDEAHHGGEPDDEVDRAADVRDELVAGDDEKIV